MTIALAFMATGFVFADKEMIYSLGDSALTFGTGYRKAETYNVALRINDNSLVGARVKAVRVAFPYVEGLSEARAWLSKELPAIKSMKAGEPDIASKSFEVAKGYTEITFDEPYTITADGVYVGYAFKTAKADDESTQTKPVVTTAYTSPDGFYIHSTGTYRTAWRSLYSEAGQLAIQVVLESDSFKDNAVSVTSVDALNVQTGNVSEGTFVIANHGTNGVSAIDYTVSVAGQEYSAQADVSVKSIYGAPYDVKFSLPAIAEKGSYPLTITVTKVNGVANEDAIPSSQAVVNAYVTLPVHRAVLEEYTGTWCGYCPRGFVGLEEMNRLYPDDFIAISYHDGDPMQVIGSSDYAWNAKVLGSFPGYPAASLDRMHDTDAFCGDGEYYKFGIDKTWKDRADVFAPAAVDIDTRWADDNTLEATAYVAFPISADECPYEVSFVLVEDGMTGDSKDWAQSNYYSGETSWPESMAQFTSGASYVTGLVFNDVFVAWSGKAGIAGSLSAPIVEDVAQRYTYSFKIDEILNSDKAQLVQDKSRLRVIALLLSTQTGEIVNANKVMAGQNTTTGVSRPAVSTAEVVSRVAWYDVQGRRVLLPQHGLYVKVETLADGTRRVQKMLVK
ncbi:MAG: hypothetical protein IJV36_08045 [Prevotella sp.]|nr:hypothetical protein [Prevotella sp.]